MRLDPKVWNILLGFSIAPIILILFTGAFFFETIEKLSAVPAILPLAVFYGFFILIFLGGYLFKDKDGCVSIKVVIRGSIFMIFLFFSMTCFWVVEAR